LKTTNYKTMDHKLFCRAYHYARARLAQEDPLSIFEYDLPEANSDNTEIEWHLEDKLNIAVTIVFRMGMPYVDEATIQGGDLSFIFRSFYGKDVSNMDLAEGVSPHIWSERHGEESCKENPEQLAKYAIKDMKYALDCFKSIVETIEILTKE
jgi:hypothetical protein